MTGSDLAHCIMQTSYESRKEVLMELFSVPAVPITIQQNLGWETAQSLGWEPTTQRGGGTPCFLFHCRDLRPKRNALA